MSEKQKPEVNKAEYKRAAPEPSTVPNDLREILADATPEDVARALLRPRNDLK